MIARKGFQVDIFTHQHGKSKLVQQKHPTIISSYDSSYNLFDPSRYGSGWKSDFTAVDNT